MAKPDLVTKRVCPDTGRKFYDLNKNPVVSPYTGKVVPIAATPTRAKPEPVRPAPVVEEAAIAPESADVEMVSLEDADAEAEGKKGEGDAAEGDDDIEIEETEEAPFIEEQEEGDEDVTDIVGEGREDEEET